MLVLPCWTFLQALACFSQKRLDTIEMTVSAFSIRVITSLTGLITKDTLIALDIPEATAGVHAESRPSFISKVQEALRTAGEALLGGLLVVLVMSLVAFCDTFTGFG